PDAPTSPTPAATYTTAPMSSPSTASSKPSPSRTERNNAGALGHAVPDPRDPGTLTTMPARPIQPSAKAKELASKSAVGTLAISCWNQWSYVEKKDVFGSRIYRYNVETDWCYDTSTNKLTNIDRAVGYINYETWQGPGVVSFCPAW
ncbi:hypothetical protein ABGB16_33975, partial [Micromonospora sp. B11E3]